MNSRQLAEKMVEHCAVFSGWTIKHIDWDGNITDTDTDSWSCLDSDDRRDLPMATIGPFNVPIIEQIINLIVQRWTVGAGGTRQHTESVNNFAVYVGSHSGIWFMCCPEGNLSIWTRIPNG